jgi:hypothetical protein
MTLVRTTKTALAFGLALQVAIATQTATMARAQQMIGTDSAIARTAAGMDRATLMDEIKKDEVRDEMVRLGVSPEEAEARLAALSDAEVARMIRQMDKDQAGADIVGTLATIFIILLVTDLLCFTRIFNFTRCVR